MSKVDFNTLQFGTPYYVFEVRNSKYANIQFIPNIFVTRIDSKKVKILVAIVEYNVKTEKGVFRKTVEYLENVDNQEDYFRSLQNSNFQFGLPSPLLFLEKVIDGIKTIIKMKDVSINCVPTLTIPKNGGCPKCAGGICCAPP
jgi:hypothetical protein